MDTPTTTATTYEWAPAYALSAWRSRDEAGQPFTTREAAAEHAKRSGWEKQATLREARP